MQTFYTWIGVRFAQLVKGFGGFEFFFWGVFSIWFLEKEGNDNIYRFFLMDVVVALISLEVAVLSCMIIIGLHVSRDRFKQTWTCSS